MAASSPVIKTLQDLDFISTRDIAEVYYPRVRDLHDITVHRAEASDVIFLVDHRTPGEVAAYYEQKNDLEYWNASDYKSALLKCAMDDDRRAGDFGKYIEGHDWVDIGSGLGGVVLQLASAARSVFAVEPQPGPRELLLKNVCNENKNVTVLKNIEELPIGHFQVATLFHVMEHLSDPIHLLQQLRTKLEPGAKLIVEVPHARDSLIVDHKCEAFKAWTFWSEHLILHTRESLGAFLKQAGFSDVKVYGYQRYNLANHMCWISMGKKGGQESLAHLTNERLDQSYADHLDNRDRTDTLIAIATNTSALVEGN